MLPIDSKDIEEAKRTIHGRVLRTPLVPANSWGGTPGSLYLKLENLQRTGSFKIRGATNKIAHLTPEEARNGVITASAGNHAQGVALAARERGIKATIVMPEGASPTKVSATQALGAEIVLKGADYKGAYAEAERLCKEKGLTYIHAYNDPLVLAGQATLGLEICEDLPQVGTVVAGVGGGGLLAGIAVALMCLPNRPRIVAVQPSSVATLKRAVGSSEDYTAPPGRTIADGLATREIGKLPLSILREVKIETVEVDEDSIADAMFYLLEKEHVVAEGSGAASIAALMSRPEIMSSGPVAAVISGGNVDPFLLDSIIWRGLAAKGRILRVITVLPDRPGQLAAFLKKVGELGANVQRVRHDRISPLIEPGEVSIEVELEMRDKAHSKETLDKLRKEGFRVELVGLSGPSGD